MIVRLFGEGGAPEPVPDSPGRRRKAGPGLDEIRQDPRYLEVKERLGEPLTATERDRLEAWRAGRPAEGGGP